MVNHPRIPTLLKPVVVPVVAVRIPLVMETAITIPVRAAVITALVPAVPARPSRDQAKTRKRGDCGGHPGPLKNNLTG